MIKSSSNQKNSTKGYGSREEVTKNVVWISKHLLHQGTALRVHKFDTPMVHYQLVQTKRRTTGIQFATICRGSRMTSPYLHQPGWVPHLLCKGSARGSHCAAPTFIPPRGRSHWAHDQGAQASIIRLQIMYGRYTPRSLLAHHTATVMHLTQCSGLGELFRMPSKQINLMENINFMCFLREVRMQS